MPACKTQAQCDPTRLYRNLQEKTGVVQPTGCQYGNKNLSPSHLTKSYQIEAFQKTRFSSQKSLVAGSDRSFNASPLSHVLGIAAVHKNGSVARRLSSKSIFSVSLYMYPSEAAHTEEHTQWSLVSGEHHRAYSTNK